MQNWGKYLEIDDLTTDYTALAAAAAAAMQQVICLVSSASAVNSYVLHVWFAQRLSAVQQWVSFFTRCLHLYDLRW